MLVHLALKSNLGLFNRALVAQSLHNVTLSAQEKASSFLSSHRESNFRKSLEERIEPILRQLKLCSHLGDST